MRTFTFLLVAAALLPWPAPSAEKRVTDVLIDPSGAVVEIEEAVALTALPPSVRASFEKPAGRGRILGVESITKNNAVVAYEARIRNGQKTSEVNLSPDGAAMK